MYTLHSQLPNTIEDLIREYNTVSKFNSFLYDNPDCNELFKTYESKDGEPMWKGWGGRDQFITRCHQIEKELTPVIREMYHGQEVRVYGTRLPKEGVRGTIKHELTHTYSRSDGTEGVTDNNVSFRGLDDGNALCEQTIALWVETGDKYTTHLYTADRIYLVGSEEVAEVPTPELVH